MAILYQELQKALTVLSILWFLHHPVDLIIFTSFYLLKNSTTVWSSIDAHTNVALTVQCLYMALLTFLILQAIRVINGLRSPSTSFHGFSAEPMLFPCKTSHTRMFPTKHNFDYSYFLAGIPVGWKGTVGGVLAADVGDKTSWFSSKRGAWWTVNGDDYLARGHHPDGLQGKMHDYLHTQGQDPKDYPFAYLLTAPRFLGYSSNPVSIWYLYSASKDLASVILEVNNTFNERHIYFLQPTLSESSSASSSKSPSYHETWPKDFYVSVFNSRAGAYSLSANDPLFPSLHGPGNLHATITLLSSSPARGLSAKLIARVVSTTPALRPSRLSLLSKVRFLLTWWHVGLLTFFPRTVYQALVLFIRKRLRWVFRPEPRKATLPRAASESEAFIEVLFRRYLRDVVENSGGGVRVRYTGAGVEDSGTETMGSAAEQPMPDGQIEEVGIKILTPLFYSRFTRYTCTPSAFLCEIDSGTAISSNANSTFLSSLDSAAFSSISPLSWRWHLLDRLRKPPARITCLDEPFITRPFPPTPTTSAFEFETWIRNTCTPTEKDQYVSRVLKMFIASHIAFDTEELLDLEIFSLRVAAIWGLVRMCY
ncbi:hypothetical protein BJ878DRAFT_141618 [Calycina marina]|uniref:Uncharacterized protein n=1 Tax=Calycina marina TaxID=1763456 RepID=A0A9P7ZA83_9HELO|nr:hypothetical protein BJ878DRAFT_141618 [Calycina marina]